MRKFITTSALLCLFSISIFAQNVNTPCPVIEIIAPQGVTQAGETTTFSALVKNGMNTSKLEFIWAISEGTIIEGQDTPTIKLITIPDRSDATITAKVTVKGLPNDCANEASATVSIAPMIACGLPLDTYEKIPWQDEMARLQNLAIELFSEPDYEAHILLTVEKNESSRQIKNHIRKMANYLESLKINKARLIFIIEPSDHHSTSFQIRRKEAELTSCNGCEIIKGKDLK